MKNHFITAALCGFAFAGGFCLRPIRNAVSDAYKDSNSIEIEGIKTDSLKAVVADLEEKVEILNRYLVQKNLEYIDACDLKTKAK